MEQKEILIGCFHHYRRAFAILAYADKELKMRGADKFLLSPIESFDAFVPEEITPEEKERVRRIYGKEIKELEEIAKEYNKKIEGLKKPDYDLALRTYERAEKIFESVRVARKTGGG